MAAFNEQLRVGNVSFVSGCDRDNRSQANGKFRHNRTLSVWGLNDRLWSTAAESGIGVSWDKTAVP